VPENPELTVDTEAASLDDCVEQVIGEMTNRGIYSLQHDLMLDSNGKKNFLGSKENL